MKRFEGRERIEEERAQQRELEICVSGNFKDRNV